ncbi:MAG: recombination mediator RecR [Patescibacteria group bacterium]|nr:recombination mediator RecR [Patescibacteria group bacterium]
MARLPRPVQNLIEAFQRLPGIGPKTAARLTFYLLHVPETEINIFANSLVSLKKDTVVCSICFNISEVQPCQVCADSGRDKKTICVVEQAIDILSIENAGTYKGVYHVLNGVLDPLNNIGPEEIRIFELIGRLKKEEVNEVLLATNPSMEGEATAMYIKNEISNLKSQMSKLNKIKISRLAHGLPVGADIEFSDSLTLSRAIEGRREF